MKKRNYDLCSAYMVTYRTQECVIEENEDEAKDEMCRILTEKRDSEFYEGMSVKKIGDEESQESEKECWDRLMKVAEEYAQKHMHPHKTIIITKQGIELLEGEKASPFEFLY